MLEPYGWSSALQNDFAPHAAAGLVPGRVTVQQRGLYRLITPSGDLAAGLSGRLAFEAEAGGYPVAGDWVAAAARPAEGTATIQAVLPRRTLFRRRAAGPGEPAAQAVAANVDLALLLASFNADFNLRRLERYLAIAWESGAEPVVVLTKADAGTDPARVVAAAESVAAGAPVLAVSSLTGQGLAAVRALIRPGRTAVLLGSSGVGKSTLLNALAGGPVMATQAIREQDARGRHTTTHRELVLLPGGGLVLDTPGMRELGLWDAESGVSATFADIEALAQQCRFGDCAHGREPGCAVRAALEEGRLEEARWRSYDKLRRELAHLDRRDDPVARAEERRRWARISKAHRGGPAKRRWDED
ncbi:ribosome small subunit-dependent GTPase A [Labrys wisconsinensis]|uniref:Small ribosomal subunit biogenesis GTPase RsgA n=1 Tax=Labrys wisconsinensis TaxID=425677 RepID=A0ABU0JL49_9HYPH|nr:ribosome small subunit-dependent GTPase A [Labrys wisconsinensis]MDQ0474998.1 ribosome biogenesis GTPase [Labrys wisconsinensis]